MQYWHRTRQASVTVRHLPSGPNSENGLADHRDLVIDLSGAEAPRSRASLTASEIGDQIAVVGERAFLSGGFEAPWVAADLRDLDRPRWIDTTDYPATQNPYSRALASSGTRLIRSWEDGTRWGLEVFDASGTSIPQRLATGHLPIRASASECWAADVAAEGPFAAVLRGSIGMAAYEINGEGDLDPVLIEMNAGHACLSSLAIDGRRLFTSIGSQALAFELRSGLPPIEFGSVVDVKRHVRSDEVIVDIGAAGGHLFVLHGSSLQPESHVSAFDVRIPWASIAVGSLRLPGSTGQAGVARILAREDRVLVVHPETGLFVLRGLVERKPVSSLCLPFALRQPGYSQ